MCEKCVVYNLDDDDDDAETRAVTASASGQSG